MRDDFEKTIGNFVVRGSYGGHPHWHEIVYRGVEFRHLVVEDLRDLSYAIERAIAHHAAHGDKGDAQ